MEFMTERRTLQLKQPFTISHGTMRTKEIVVLHARDGEDVGVGAAAPAGYLGDSVERVERDLPELLGAVEEAVLHRVDGLLPENMSPSALAAVSTALHDLSAKRRGLPLYEYLGLPEPRPTPTSLTVATESVDAAGGKAREAVEDGFEVLKVKAGFTDDVELVRAVREAAPDARIRVDANAGWSTREAIRKIESLESLGVEFVEQPVDDLERLPVSPLPIAADESCVSADDVPDVASHVDVVVVKLMKCGGIQEALRIIEAARSHCLEVMLGCMIESNASLSAAVHLLGRADYADLDGSLLLENDPYRGVPIRSGRVDPGAVMRGSGVRPR